MGVCWTQLTYLASTLQNNGNSWCSMVQKFRKIWLSANGMMTSFHWQKHLKNIQ